MLAIVLFLVFVACLISILNWRWGIFVCIVVAIMQDPLRKLIPDEPVYFVGLVGIIFASTVLGSATRISFSLNKIYGWNRQLKHTIVLFGALLFIQGVHSFIRFGNPMFPVLGGLFYVTPIPAIIIGYYYSLSQSSHGILGWYKFYVFCAVLALSGVYLEFAGFDWPILGEVGLGIIIYDAGTILTAYSGFFRSSEIAAWHCAAAVCFIFLIVTQRRFTLQRLFIALTIMGALVGIGLLTGRRKMLVEITIFIFSYMFFIVMIEKRRKILAISLLLAGVLSYLSLVGFLGQDVGDPGYRMERYNLYVQRSKGTISEIPDRLSRLGIQPVSWAINRYGFFGAGLGTGSQGAQHFGGGGAVFGGASEGGLGKITVELGIPGLILFIWLFYLLLGHVWKILKYVSRTSKIYGRLTFGLVSFLVANFAAFSVATQAYGDIFILLFLGLTSGFIFAMPLLVESEMQRTTDSRKEYESKITY